MEVIGVDGKTLSNSLQVSLEGAGALRQEVAIERAHRESFSRRAFVFRADDGRHVEPVGDGLQAEALDGPWRALEDRAPVAGSSIAELAARALEVDEVHPVVAEHFDDAGVQIANVELAARKIGQIPVGMRRRVASCTRAVEDERVQPGESLGDFTQSLDRIVRTLALHGASIPNQRISAHPALP